MICVIWHRSGLPRCFRVASLELGIASLSRKQPWGIGTSKWEVSNINCHYTTERNYPMYRCAAYHSMIEWKRCGNSSGGCLSIKMPSYQYGHSHVKDKTVSPTVLSLTWESPYLGKMFLKLRQGPGGHCWSIVLVLCHLINFISIFFLVHRHQIIHNRLNRYVFINRVPWQASIDWVKAIVCVSSFICLVPHAF